VSNLAYFVRNYLSVILKYFKYSVFTADTTQLSKIDDYVKIAKIIIKVMYKCETLHSFVLNIA